MGLTKQYLRRSVAGTSGDLVIVVPSELGASDGSTIVVSSLNGRQDDADLGKWAVVSLPFAVAISTVNAGSPAIITTTLAHGLGVGDTIAISACSELIVNGTWTVANVLTTTQFTAINAMGAPLVSVTGAADGSIASAGNVTVKFSYISSSAGPPDPNNPPNYTLYLTPPLGQQVGTSNTVEIMAYRPDWYTRAINLAVQHTFPSLYKYLFDTSITVSSDLQVTAYDLPNGTNTLYISSFTLASPTVITTTVPHRLKLNASVTISGCSDSSMNGVHIVNTIPSETTFTCVSLNSSVGGSAGTITTPGNTILPGDVTRVQMTGYPSPVFGQLPYIELPDWTILPTGDGDTYQIVFNLIGRPFNTGLRPGASIVLTGWQMLTGVPADNLMYTLVADDDPSTGPELPPGSQYDALLQEFIRAYLFQLMMSAPSTPDRAAFAEMFQQQWNYATLQVGANQMQRPQRRRAL